MKISSKSTFFIVLIMIFFNILPAQACTLWAAHGTYVEGGGSLIIKNRDWQPDHRQGLKLVTPETGYRYFGLFQLDGDAPGLRAGINEKGLVIISASASSIPAGERYAMPRTHGLLSKILNQCASVDAALAQSHWFVGPQFIMLADKEKVARIEIGPEGKTAVTVTDNGVSYHTNHYVEEQLYFANKTIGSSSQTRYNRIAELLDNSSKPYTLDSFLSMSNDQIAGPDNSIFRVGSTRQKARTLATWAVSIPIEKSPEIYVRILNPGEAVHVYRITAEDIFAGKWNQKDGLP